MNYTFKLMNQKEAEAIAKWHYSDRYSFYDFENDTDDLAELLDPRQRNYQYYSVYNEEALVGFFSFNYDRDNRTTTVGLGMVPHMTGHGRGGEFFEKGLAFGQKTFPGALVFQLAVASFNKRAIIIYERSGFKKISESMIETNGGIYKFLHMEKQLNHL